MVRSRRAMEGYRYYPHLTLFPKRQCPQSSRLRPVITSSAHR